MNAPAVRRVPHDRIVTSLASRRRTILDVIRHAEREISLSMFRCDDEQILDGLAHATSRGVAVDVLVTRRTKGNPGRLEELKKALGRAGATVHTYADPSVKYHAKYLVADAGPAIVASLNFTQKCFERTCDALVVTYDPGIVSGLRRLIAADCSGLPLPEALSPRLIVGPERARRQFKALIDGARSSIRLIDAKLSDANLLALLEARRTMGLTVEIFGSRWVGDLKSHGKIMLVDDRVAVVGSVAFTATSLDLRRELAIVIDEPAAVADVRRLFRMAAIPRAGRTAVAATEGWALC
jgi:phosphatidylserine/phosphatidylglycerophosphate/cardiolipin synthase-like enzyme